MNEPIESIKTGFWLRFLATWMDCLFIYAVLKIFFYSLLYMHPFYFPFNFTFILVGIVYSTILISFKGQTIGKYLLGIKVLNYDGTKLSLLKSILRESILKIISGVVFFLGFFWIGFSKNKKGWHDYLCKSRVLQFTKPAGFNKFSRTLAFSTFIVFTAIYMWSIAGVVIDAKKISLNPESVKFPFIERNLADVADVSEIKDSSLINWLNKYGEQPADYLIKAAANHQITLLGEIHENRDNLDFLNQMIGPLYYKSNIRVIAMEVIPALMNKKAEQLVNGKTYDSVLAMEIARGQCWKIWGWKEYWDILKTVWKLNHSLPEGAEKMRVVGLDGDWEMADIFLSGVANDSRGKSPFWEKLRILSSLKNMVNAGLRDNIMARNIEKEIIDKNQKAVVLIGFNHTLINYTNAIVKDKKIVALNPRFAVLLSQKYKDKFFQIELYQNLDLNEDNKVCGSSIDDLFDSVMKKRNLKPVAFTIASSPFEKIRDSCAMYFSRFPSVRYGDIAQALIFLKPYSEKEHCTWMQGYISDQMFMENKPMYVLMINQRLKFKNAKELNQVFIDAYNKGIK